MQKAVFPRLPKRKLSNRQNELIEYLIQKTEILLKDNPNSEGYISIKTIHNEMDFNYRHLLDTIDRLKNIGLIKKRKISHPVKNKNWGRRYHKEIKLDSFALACVPAKYLRNYSQQNLFLQKVKQVDKKNGTGVIKEIFNGFRNE